VGDIVNEGDVIGKTGNTGNSTGEHLHFQIDRADSSFHPFWPYTFAEANAAGLSFFEAINKGLGMEKAKKYTVNPFVYLDAVAGASASATTTTTTTTTTTSAQAKPISTVVATEVLDSNPTPPSSGFFDVADSSPYAAAVKYLVKKGAVNAANSLFRPNDSVSRVEFLKIVFLDLGIAAGNNSVSSFSDLENGAWYIPYINTAKAQNIIGGYSDGTFRPNNPVSRAEAAKIILVAKKVQIDTDTSLPSYTDVPTDAWYAPYAQAVKLDNLLTTADGQFHPDAPMSRGEVAEFLYRLSQ